jgi:DNA-binding response OmpR family regulator
MSKSIFIVDDEPDMVKIATDLLESDGFVVYSDTHPAQALKKIRTNPPDLVILDLRMPDMDGYHVCKELKADPKTKHLPIIMVSVKSEETDVVVGLEMGADDYISKPFRKRELLARVKTVLRRLDMDPRDQKIECGPFTVDYGSYSATLNNKTLALTPKEFELLGFFIRREGRVVTRAAMSENVWGTEFTGSTRTIDVHVDQLRKKLGKYSTWIHGLKGIGYRFEKED